MLAFGLCLLPMKLAHQRRMRRETSAHFTDSYASILSNEFETRFNTQFTFAFTNFVCITGDNSNA